MRVIRYFSWASILVASSAFAQILSVESRSALQLTGLDSTEQIGGTVFVASTTEIKSVPVVLVEAKTEAANIVFEASDKDRVPVEFDQLTDKIIVVRSAGKTWIDCTAIDFEKNLYGRKVIVVQLSDVPPDDDDDDDEPPEPPDPDVGNEYGVGLAAYKNAPPVDTKPVAALYRRAADMLYGRPRAMTIDDALPWIDESIKMTPDGDSWEAWMTVIDMAMLESQRKREGFSRQDWYAAFNEIAKALEAVK